MESIQIELSASEALHLIAQLPEDDPVLTELKARILNEVTNPSERGSENPEKIGVTEESDTQVSDEDTPSFSDSLPDDIDPEQARIQKEKRDYKQYPLDGGQSVRVMRMGSDKK